MENQMDNIINRLSHIEDTAVRIMESVDSEKKKIASEMEEKTREFDEKLASDTQKQLDELRVRLNAQKDMELEKLRLETNKVLEQFQAKFDEKHSQWAQEILTSIIEE